MSSDKNIDNSSEINSDMSNAKNMDDNMDNIAGAFTESMMFTLMNALQESMERIEGGRDKAMMLLAGHLPEQWAAAVTMMKTLYAPEALQQVEPSDVSIEEVRHIIAGKSFRQTFMVMGDRCLDMFDEALKLSREMACKPKFASLLPVMAERYGEAFGKDSLALGHEVPLTVDVAVDQVGECLSLVHDALLHMRLLLCQVLQDGDQVTKPFEVTCKELVTVIISGFRKYVAKHHRRIEKLLRHHSNSFRPRRTSPLTPEVWGELYDAEERATEAADAEVLMESEGFGYLDGHERMMMQQHHALLSRIQLNCIDEEIYNFKDAIECNDLLEDLSDGNLDYFYERVHRRNLIQIGMFPHLKEEYEEFLKGNDHPWEKATPQAAGVGETAAGREPAVLFTPEAMRMWQALQQAEMIDEDYQPMLSMRKASVIASVMGGRLGMSPLWEPFEMLWDAKNLGNSYSQAQIGKYYGDLMKEICNVLK